jgi:hypothetical protein
VLAHLLVFLGLVNNFLLYFSVTNSFSSVVRVLCLFLANVAVFLARRVYALISKQVRVLAVFFIHSSLFAISNIV